MKKFATRIVSLFLVLLLAVSAVPAGNGGVVKAEKAKVVDGEGEDTGLEWEIKDNTLTISGTGSIPDLIDGYPWDAQMGSVNKIVIADGVESLEDASYAFDPLSASVNYSTIEIGKDVKAIKADVFNSECVVDVKINRVVAPEIKSTTYLGQKIIKPFAAGSTIHVPSNAVGYVGASWDGYTLVKDLPAGDDVGGEDKITISSKLGSLHANSDVTFDLGENVPGGANFFRWTLYDADGDIVELQTFDNSEGIIVEHPERLNTTLEGAGTYRIKLEVRKYTIEDGEVTDEEKFDDINQYFNVVDHSYVSLNNKVEPTCTVEGKEADMKCSICGDIKAGAAIPKLGHKEVSKIENGKKIYYCSVCGEETRPAEIIPVPAEPAKKGETIKPKKAEFKVTNTSDKNASVTFTKTTSTSKKVSIPATVKDESGKTYKVTAIAKNALKGNTKVTEVKVGKNVTTIGASAFQKATKLKTVNIEGKLAKIDKNAFSGAKSLKSVTLNGNSLKSVGKNAFKGVSKNCKITIQAKNKTQYNKIVKMIKKSGAKKVAFKFKKKK